MTFTNIKKRIASNIGYVDSSGDLLASKDVTATDLGNWVNDRYLDELVPMLSAQYPEDYERVAKASFYKVTGTVDSTAGDTTIVATTSIFTNGMVGDTIYNDTDDETAKITAYTSTTTVTIDSDVDNDWDGDTIYVLGHEFALAGDITDMRYIREVGVKYNSSDSFYRVATYMDQNNLFKSGWETYSKTSPVWYMSSTTVSSATARVLGILPEPTIPLTNAIRVRYTQLPAALSGDSDTPDLPLGSHSVLVYGGTADALRKLRRHGEANDFETLYQQKRSEILVNYPLTRGSKPVKVRASRRARQMMDYTR